MKKAFRMLFLIAWSSVLLPVLVAQQPGVVRGAVEDPSGAPVAAASVKLTAKAAGTELKTVTDEKGHFVFPEVPPGKYVLRVKMEGFQKAEVPVEVGATPTPPQRVRLALAKVEEEITVSMPSISINKHEICIYISLNGRKMFHNLKNHIVGC